MAKIRTLKPGIRTLSGGVLRSTWSRASTREERERDRDKHRRAQQPWRAWYKLEIWDHPTTGLRTLQLERMPICETCRRAPATIAHHKRPHNGIWELFIDPRNLESACKPCHDGAIQRGERAGNYARVIDLNSDVAVAANILYPAELHRSAIPLALVCGAPASGKSTFVEKNRQPGEIVIDVDAIVAELAGTPVRSNETKRDYLQAAMVERNRRLHALAREQRAPGAWFIVGAPSGTERARWARELGATRVIVISTPDDECVARIGRDANRAPIADELASAVYEWWRHFTRSAADEIIRG
jgi:5-methylcytosine-specific restriction protein A